jgi:RHH-type transcriptional regulator, rel operon repressor / antitoxin RelB
MATSIRLTPDLEQRLDYLASQTGRTKAFYLREIIATGLDDMEDLYLAEQRLIDLRAGRSQTHTLDDVEQSLGLVD